MSPPRFAADDTLRAVPETPRFIVGIDFSAGSRKALDEARRLASLCGATVTVAHVRPASDVRSAVLEDRGDLIRSGGRVLARQLDEHYTDKLAQWVREGERAIVLRGAPEVALTREAGRGYTLLVLASTGQNAVSNLLMGATTERAVGRSTVPVLIVPTGPRPSRGAR
jgi:nucleotide-binding universal stress UspA family protein